MKDDISSIGLYADDYPGQPGQTENNLLHALNLLHKWCLENGMLLNTDKQN